MENNLISNLNNIIKEEYIALRDMFSLLEDQHSLLLKKDTMKLEQCVKDLNECSKKVAQCEMNRRKFLNGKSLVEIVNSSNNEELKENYRSINGILNMIKVQKEDNELIIKQGLIFYNKMLTVLNPDRTIKTYKYNGRINK